MRARNEGVIELELSPAADSEQGHAEGEGRVAARAGIHQRGRAADAWLRETVPVGMLPRLEMVADEYGILKTLRSASTESSAAALDQTAPRTLCSRVSA